MAARTLLSLQSAPLELKSSPSITTTLFRTWRTTLRTAITFTDNERLIGVPKPFSTNCIKGFNRFMGMKQNSQWLAEECKYTNAKHVVRDNQEIGFEFVRGGENKVFAPEQLCAMFLQKLKDACEAANIRCRNVVIAVPPYFSPVERQAVMDAAKIANLNCYKLINETTSIGLCYGLLMHRELAESGKHVMFVDMGHAKLTVAVMKFTNTQFSILAQGWETNLGGRNFDSHIVEKLIGVFQSKHKRDLRGNARAIERLYEVAERGRIILSVSNETVIKAESLIEDIIFLHILRRKDFEEMIMPDVLSLLNLCNRVLTEAKLDPQSLHSIEMVGEATQTPVIRQRLQETFKVPLLQTLSGADCIARGCAIQCAICNDYFHVKDYAVIDCSPFPIDVVYNTCRPEDSKKSKSFFEKGSNFPVFKRLSFANRREPIDLQIVSPSALPLGGPTVFGNYKISPDSAVENDFVVSIKIVMDENMIPYIPIAELVENYYEESKIVVKRFSPDKGRKQDMISEDINSEYNTRPLLKKRQTPLHIDYEVHGLTSKVIAEYAELEKQMHASELAALKAREAQSKPPNYIPATHRINPDFKDYGGGEMYLGRPGDVWQEDKKERAGGESLKKCEENLDEMRKLVMSAALSSPDYQTAIRACEKLESTIKDAKELYNEMDYEKSVSNKKSIEKKKENLKKQIEKHSRWCWQATEGIKQTTNLKEVIRSFEEYTNVLEVLTEKLGRELREPKKGKGQRAVGRPRSGGRKAA